MIAKGKIKISKISQERALEFDEKDRASLTLKSDLISLRKEFTSKEDIHFQTWPSNVPEYSEEFYREIKTTILKYLDSIHNNFELAFHFYGSLREFMVRYGFSREWKIPLTFFILSGYYHLPEENYHLEQSEDYPNSVSITIGKHTTERDIIKAHKEAQKLFPQEKNQHGGYAKSYSWANDPRTVDLIKETEIHLLNKKKLNTEEKYIYDTSKDLKTASDEILKRRTKFRAAGEKGKTGRPKFIKSLSDKEYFSSTEGKDAAKKLTEKLKKVRIKHKKPL